MSSSTAFENWSAKARAVKIEDEIARRGIRLRGIIERCGPCPKCGGEDRFSINTKKGVWNCRQCDVGGDVIKLVEHLDSVDFIGACTTLAGEPPPKPNGKDRTGTKPKKVVVAEYPYRDESGAVAFVVERIEYQSPDGSFVIKDGKRKKTFSQKRPDPDHPGEWLWNVDGVAVLPYRLPDLVGAIATGRPALIVEGERKADLLWSWGIAATCNAGGQRNGNRSTLNFCAAPMFFSFPIMTTLAGSMSTSLAPRLLALPSVSACGCCLTPMRRTTSLTGPMAAAPANN
jgi:hypothetical protein